MAQMHKYTDVFLTHTWKHDEEGRDNHSRVNVINEHLSRRGFTTWFDSQKMEGNIREKMAEGVDYTNCVIVFVTKQYMQKLDSGDEKDNCLYEYKRAINRKTAKKMICVTMEKCIDRPSSWEGYLKETMAESLAVRFSGDMNNRKYVEEQLDDLVKQLEMKGVNPSQMRQHCTKCTIVDSENNRHPLCADGKYCPYCGNGLQDADEPKHYCSACNIHENGPRCGSCGTSLVDEEKIIQEMEEQYTQLLKLKGKIDCSKYPPLEQKYKEKLKNFKMEIDGIKEARNALQVTGVDFVLKDELYIDEIKTLEDDMTTLHEDGSQLPEAARMLIERAPKYHERVQQLEVCMQNLTEERYNVQEMTRTLSRTEASCDEKMETIDIKLEKLKRTGAEVDKHLLPNHDHERSCSCKICLYQAELTMKLQASGFQYIVKLIKANKTETLDLAIQLKHTILNMKDDHLQTPLHCAAEYGRPEIMKMLLEKGADVAVKDTEGRTPLMAAYRGKNTVCINQLKPYVKDSDLEYRNFLEYNLEKWGFKYIEYLVKHDDVTGLSSLVGFRNDVIKMKDDNQRTPFIYIAEYGTPEMLIMLLGKGADVDLRDAQGRTPLMAAYDANNVVCIDELKQHVIDSDLEYRNFLENKLEKNGFGYIEKLVKEDDVTALSSLVGFRNDVIKMADNNQRTPLIYTAEYGTPEMLRMLLEKGADVDVKDAEGRTSLMAAYDANNEVCIEELKQHVKDSHLEYRNFLKYNLEREGFKYIEKLVKHDDVMTLSSLIDIKNDVINIRDDDWNTPFLYASLHGTLRIVQMLVEKGSDVSAAGSWGQTVFHRVAYNKSNYEIVKWLSTNYSVMIDMLDDSGYTPLHTASRKDNITAVTVLLQHAASITLKTKQGMTPLDYAKSCQKPSIVKVLEDWLREHDLPIE